MTAERLGYRPGLDGLRGLAVVAVAFGHFEIAGFNRGAIGVDVFFALSGFLITALLIEELRGSGRVDLRAFWRRRALRLLPCLVTVVASCVVLAPLLPTETQDGVLPALFYFANWQRAFGGDVGALGHTWSLAIEEQFYLLWPVAFVVSARFGLRRMAGVMLGLALAVAVARDVLAGSLPVERIYNGSDLRADGILLGCALALGLYSGLVPRWFSHRGTIAALVAAAMGAMVWDDLRPWSGHFVAGVATCSLLAAVFRGDRFRLLELPSMRWLGKRCYGLYLWHWPVAILVGVGAGWERSVLAVVVTVTVAAASYRYVEEPFLRLKRSGTLVLDAPVDDVAAGERERRRSADECLC